MIAKNLFAVLLDVNQVKIAMKPIVNMSWHLLNAYTKFQIDISKPVEQKSGKRTDRRSDDGWTLPRHNTAVFQMGV